jgi:hypothetical protein
VGGAGVAVVIAAEVSAVAGAACALTAVAAAVVDVQRVVVHAFAALVVGALQPSMQALLQQGCPVMHRAYSHGVAHDADVVGELAV